MGIWLAFGVFLFLLALGGWQLPDAKPSIRERERQQATVGAAFFEQVATPGDPWG